VWWCIPVIPALVRQRQEDPEFKASLCYITRPYPEREERKRRRNKGGRKIFKLKRFKILSRRIYF
jgi:hypothetical protein